MELRHLRYLPLPWQRPSTSPAPPRPSASWPAAAVATDPGAGARNRHAAVQAFCRVACRRSDAGHAFLEDAQRILRDAEQATERARRTWRVASRARIRVGMINSAPFHALIPQVVREFRKRYPNVAFTLDEGTTPGLRPRQGACSSSTMDLAFVRPLLETDRSLHMEPLLDEEMLVALPSGHPLCARACGFRCWRCRSNPSCCSRDRSARACIDEIIRACREAGFSPRVVQEDLAGHFHRQSCSGGPWCLDRSRPRCSRPISKA